MKIASLFRPAEEEIYALIAAHPLALVISGSGETASATPLPLFAERDPSSRMVLVGHFATANPQAQRLKDGERALAVFQGPHTYVSPSWMRDRTQAPTWNYMVIELAIELELVHGADAVRPLIESLVDRMEAGRPNAWRAAELGVRYEKLLGAVIGFRGRVVAARAKFKLGQNERIDVLNDILSALDADGATAIAQAMRKANLDRLAPGLPDKLRAC